MFLYRYSDCLKVNSFIDSAPYLEKFEVIKETKCGYWIHTWGQFKKWVPKKGKNLYAWDTEEKALFNYIKRKERQVEILNSQLKRTNIFLTVGNELMKKYEGRA